MALPTPLVDIFKSKNKTYKMTLMLSIIGEMKIETGRALYSKVREQFLSFYQDREAQGLIVEKVPENLHSWREMTLGKLGATIYTPVKALSDVIERSGDWIGFRSEVWNEMTLVTIEELREYAEREREDFYRELVEVVRRATPDQPNMKVIAVGADFTRIYISLIRIYITSHGFTYADDLITNFYLSLKSKPFVILAGISGTGKTKLIKLFAEALGATTDNGQFTLIPVRPDWSDPADLIGFTDLSGEFHPGEITKVLHEASQPENQHKPYFICLDEMNLARVEHYFSDLLSIMETQRWTPETGDDRRITTAPVIKTYRCTSKEKPYTNLCIPENVYIIGTVNMDETTHPFSKKVLDRANTIEFNDIDLDNLDFLTTSGVEDRPQPIQVDQSLLRSDYLYLLDVEDEYQHIIRNVSAKLTQINKYLEPIHAHVGFRVRDAISFYLIYNQRFNLMDEAAAFDIQLCQKILPRLQGSSMALEEALTDLKKFADENSCPETAKKLSFMLRRYRDDGFTSFWLS